MLSGLDYGRHEYENSCECCVMVVSGRDALVVFVQYVMVNLYGNLLSSIS